MVTLIATFPIRIKGGCSNADWDCGWRKGTGYGLSF